MNVCVERMQGEGVTTRKCPSLSDRYVDYLVCVAVFIVYEVHVERL